MTAAPASGPMLCAACASTRAAARPKRVHATPQKRTDHRERRSSPEALARRAEARKFYGSARWKKVRAQVRARDGECLECGDRERLTVDHVIPRAVAPHLAYAPDNLRTLCASCHGRKDGARAHASQARRSSKRAPEAPSRFLEGGYRPPTGREPSRSAYGSSTSDAMDTEREPVVG